MSTTAYGLSSAGFLARRSSYWLQQIRDDYESATGLEVDWDTDTFLGTITTIVADRLGSLSEAGQAVYDAWDLNNATGLQLSNLALLVAVIRNLATKGTATVTATGTAGTIIPAGSIVEGGGDDDDQRWETLVAVTIGGGGTVDLTVQATDAGAITATVGQIDRIVTPVDGWTSVTNAAAVTTSDTAGQSYETDAELRIRRAASLQIAGASSNKALRANLLALDFLTSVGVVENDKPYVRLVSGVSMPANSLRVYLLPNTLTAAQQTTVAETIWEHATAGIELSASPVDVSKQVTAADGYAKTVEWSWGVESPQAVVVTVALDLGYVIGDVDTAIQALVTDFFSRLVMGQPVYDLSLEVLAAGVDGVVRAEATIGGATSQTPALNEVLTLSGTPTVTL